MRRSDHPSRPSAITCSRFSALKTLAIPAAGAKPTAHVNVSAPGAALAGFQVSINGRFWVSTEAVRRTRRGRVEGRLDHGLDLLRTDDGLAARPRLLEGQPRHAATGEALAPEQHGWAAHPDLAGDRGFGPASGGEQDDPRS